MFSIQTESDRQGYVIVPFVFTLLFFSSSNTGLSGRVEDDGIKVASRGISGSANTTPTIKTTHKKKRLRWNRQPEVKLTSVFGNN